MRGGLGGHRDGKALFIVLRVAVGRHDDAAGGAIGEFDLRFGERAVAAGLHDRQQVALEQRQDDLCLGVAEAAVVFDDLRAVRRQHQAKIQAAAERAPLGVHRAHGGQKDGAHACTGDVIRVIRVWGDGAHAAGVEPLVMVMRPLVVHRGHHGHDGLAVRKVEHGDLRSGEKFLNYHLTAAVAEGTVEHDGLDRCDGGRANGKWDLRGGKNGYACDDSVVEQARAGEGQHHAVLVGGGDDVVVADRAARLCDVGHAGFSRALAHLSGVSAQERQARAGFGRAMHCVPADGGAETGAYNGFVKM